MADRTSTDPVLVELEVADPPRAWAAAGFAVGDDRCTIGAVRLRFVGRDERRGIVGWSIAGASVDGDLDGLPTTVVDAATASPAQAVPHPNGVVGLDHIVVLTPDLERTILACDRAGLGLRRIREGDGGDGRAVRQAFFRLGSTILEVVSGPGEGSGQAATEAPATWFGLAVDVADLDETAEVLGEALGPIKGAVQEGRRIATLRHRDLGVSVAIAAMDDHAAR